MPRPIQEHVQIVLNENQRGAKLYQAVFEGWSNFKEGYPDRGKWLRKSTARHVMWEEVADLMKGVAAEDPGIEAIEHQDTLSLVVDDEVLIRLKHADTGLLTANYPTSEALQFDRHEVDLFGRVLNRVRLCYVLDEFENDLVWVGIAAHEQQRLLWKMELDDRGMVKEPARLPLHEADADTSRLVRLKKGAADAGDEKKKKDNG